MCIYILGRVKGEPQPVDDQTLAGRSGRTRLFDRGGLCELVKLVRVRMRG